MEIKPRTYKDIIEIFDLCNRGIEYQEVGDHVNYAFEERGDTLYIYFEPSNGKEDWLNNFDFWKEDKDPLTPYKDMEIQYKVHGGFLKCWKQVEDIIIEKITEQAAGYPEGAYRWKTIVVVGYSHGGALAFFGHECCWYHRPDIRDNIWTIAFDAPRVYAGYWIKPSLARRWDQFYLFRNGRDIVTHVPPYIFGFKHVGHKIKIGKNQKVNAIDAHRPENIRPSLEEWTKTVETENKNA
jgi:hypothetical protein